MLVFEHKHDAERVMAVLPKRFGKYGLTLHPEKTKIVEFVRPDCRARRVGRAAGPRSGTFDFLGFTHYWGRSRKGKWIVCRKTAKDRFRRALKEVHRWCRWHRHEDLETQRRILAWKLRGHYGYYGITGNLQALRRFHFQAVRTWRRWLSYRSQRARLNWDRMTQLLERYPLPQPRIAHPYQRAANP